MKNTIITAVFMLMGLIGIFAFLMGMRNIQEMKYLNSHCKITIPALAPINIIP